MNKQCCEIRKESLEKLEQLSIAVDGNVNGENSKREIRRMFLKWNEVKIKCDICQSKLLMLNNIDLANSLLKKDTEA